jgi:phage shock protein C
MDRLYRSRDDRMLAGVAGGLAQMWGADPSLVRVIWALLAIFTGGLAFIVYIVMALVIPEEPPLPDAADGQALVEGTPAANAQSARATRRAAGGNSNSIPAAAIFGGFLIVLGGFFLVRQFLPQIDFDWVWPLILVGLGVLLVVSAVRRPSDRA